MPQHVPSAAERERLRLDTEDFHQAFLWDYGTRLTQYLADLETARKTNDELLSKGEIEKEEYDLHLEEYRRLVRDTYKAGIADLELRKQHYLLRIQRIGRLRVVRGS